MKCRSSSKAAAMVLTILIVIPSPAFPVEQARVSVLVQPLYDGNADDVSERIARDVSASIVEFENCKVVDFDKATNIIDYHRRKRVSSQKTDDVERILESAKEHYFKFNYRKAREGLKKCIAIIETKERGIQQYGETLLDAYLSLAVVSKSQGDLKNARDALKDAIGLNPRLTLSEIDYPPSFIAMLDEIRGGLRDQESGVLKVITRPPAISVYINGIAQGSTPLRLEDFPVGTYSLLIKDPRYISIERQIDVLPESTTNVHERLRWRSKKSIRREREAVTARAEAMLGLSMADVLKTDKTILVDVDSQDDGAYINVRMLDRKFRTGHRPIVAKIDESEERLNRTSKFIINSIRSQVNENVTVDTSKKIAPPGLGAPILMEKRKRSLMKNPLFWGAVGVAAAGAIAGGVAAAMSSGSSDTGRVRVNFK